MLQVNFLQYLNKGCYSLIRKRRRKTFLRSCLCASAFKKFRLSVLTLVLQKCLLFRPSACMRVLHHRIPIASHTAKDI